MEAQIYLAEGAEKQGPFDRREVERRLLAGEITGTTLAWRAGMTNWVPVTTLLDNLGPSLNAPSRSYEPESGKPPGVGRLIYFFGNLGANVIAGAVAEAMKAAGGGDAMTSLSVLITLVIGLGVGLSLGFLRLKNIGYNPWWTLLMVIPCIGLIIAIPCLLAPAGYARTKTLDLPAKIVGGVLVGLVVLGVLAVLVAGITSAK